MTARMLLRPRRSGPSALRFSGAVYRLSSTASRWDRLVECFVSIAEGEVHQVIQRVGTRIAERGHRDALLGSTNFMPITACHLIELARTGFLLKEFPILGMTVCRPRSGRIMTLNERKERSLATRRWCGQLPKAPSQPRNKVAGTWSTRQVSSGGPPPQLLRDPGQPLHRIIARSSSSSAGRLPLVELDTSSVSTWDEATAAGEER